MNKTKILFLIPSLKIAGAEKVCCNICDNLDYSEFDVHIISISDITPLYDTLINKDKIKLNTCSEPENIKLPWFSIKSFGRLYKIVNKLQPDVVHSHLWGIHCIYLYTFLIFRNKPKFVATIHSSEFIYTSKKISSRLFKFIENTAYRIFRFKLIAISDSVELMAKKTLNHNGILKIENGIDTFHFCPERKLDYIEFKENNYKFNYPVIVHVGRAAEEKRQVDIIKSIPHLIDLYPNIKLILVGRDNKDYFFEFVKELGIEKNIEFIKPNNEIIKYLSIADIGIFPSLYEGLSLAFAEMMSCGLPLIISNIPSLTEMTNQTEAALIVPTKNPEAIAEKVKYLIQNPEIAIAISKKARQLVVEKYSLVKMVDSHSKLYKSLV